MNESKVENIQGFGEKNISFSTRHHHAGTLAEPLAHKHFKISSAFLRFSVPLKVILRYYFYIVYRLTIDYCMHYMLLEYLSNVLIPVRVMVTIFE